MSQDLRHWETLMLTAPRRGGWDLSMAISGTLLKSPSQSDGTFGSCRRAGEIPPRKGARFDSGAEIAIGANGDPSSRPSSVTYLPSRSMEWEVTTKGTPRATHTSTPLANAE